MRVTERSCVITVYTCETCNKQFTNKIDCENHEKNHLQRYCEHKNPYFMLQFDDDEGNITHTITMTCRECNLIAEVSIPSDQQILKTIFTLCGGDGKIQNLYDEAKRIEAEMANRIVQRQQFETKIGRVMTPEELHAVGWDK